LKLFGIVFADLLLSFIGMLIIILVLTMMLPKEDATNKKSDLYLGSVCAEISWPDDHDTDLDVWGQSPDDETPVGYSNLHGKNLSLFRDVLGWTYNPSHRNFEVMCADHIVAGEWTFNVSYFSDHENKKQPVEVTMTLSFKRPQSGNEFWHAKYTLKEGEEKTMFNFRINENGQVIENSINSLNHPLRSVTPSTARGQ
jgi:hypothetical protein